MMVGGNTFVYQSPGVKLFLIFYDVCPVLVSFFFFSKLDELIFAHIRISFTARLIPVDESETSTGLFLHEL